MDPEAAFTRKQEQLIDQAQAFHEFLTFVAELKRATKGKPFRIRSPLAWRAVRSLHRTIVIDLAAWVDGLHGAAPKVTKCPNCSSLRSTGGKAGWLQIQMHGASLQMLRSSKKVALKQATESGEEALFVTGRADQIFRHRTEVLRRLFGVAAARRGHATGADIILLQAKLKDRAASLRETRNLHAHRYGDKTASESILRFHHQLARQFAYCGRLMNDLRSLIYRDHYSMPSLKPSQRSAPARDMVDLIVLGTIAYLAARWTGRPALPTLDSPPLYLVRDEEYAAMHRRRRKKRTDSFNEDAPKPAKIAHA